jgi:adenosine deaminase
LSPQYGCLSPRNGITCPGTTSTSHDIGRLSTTFCTDDRLVSNTTVSKEIERTQQAFALTDREVRDILIYGFKRSFYPGSYLEKRSYVREVINYANRLLGEAGAA